MFTEHARAPDPKVRPKTYHPTFIRPLINAQLINANTRPTSSEYLGPVILAVADDDVAGGGDGDALEALELAVAAAPAAEGLEEGALWAEDLYAVVAGVGDDDVALIVHGDTARKLELTLL